jgi:hypothetical protein
MGTGWGEWVKGGRKAGNNGGTLGKVGNGFKHRNRIFTHALVLKERANVFMTDVFKQGFFEVQDAIHSGCCFS